jgi:type IV secretion system protein VirB10
MSKEEPDYSFDNNNYQENTGYHEQALDEEKYKKLDKLFQEAELARRSGIGFGVNNRKSEKSSNGQITDISRDQNLNDQGNKKSFLKNEESNAAYLENFEEDPISPYEVKAGTIIPGIMITGINSDLPGSIVGQVRESVFDTVSGNYLLIPQGTKIFGTYDSNVTWGQNRSLIVWQRLIFPNGKSINLSNMPGVDLTGQAGFSDKVNNHFSTLLKGVVLTSITGAGSAIVTNDENNDYESEAAKAAGIAIINVGNNFAEKALGRQPTIEIRAGYRFNIMVNSDMILTPYK